MINIQTSAPGKVIIAGEYAVLDGAPAICMAVDRRAHVAITRSDGDHHRVLAPGYSQTVGRFTTHGSGFAWLGGEADYALLSAVWQELGVRPAARLAIVLDSNEFMDATSGTKLGIGSSAALTVALTAALDMAAGGGRSVHRIAAAAHRQLQGGAGSGADIACSLSGGIIEYRVGEAPPRALKWPVGLQFALLWSGVSSDTGAQLGKLAAAATGATRAELVAAAGEVASVWGGGRSSDVVDALRVYATVLRRFDVEHGLGIYDAGHAALAVAAESCGVVYKPCGAGGGDLGIVIACDAAAVAACVALAREQGFRHLPMAIAARGLSCDGELL
jgi:phosphomevalonate kinase